MSLSPMDLLVLDTVNNVARMDETLESIVCRVEAIQAFHAAKIAAEALQTASGEEAETDTHTDSMGSGNGSSAPVVTQANGVPPSVEQPGRPSTRPPTSNLLALLNNTNHLEEFTCFGQLPTELRLKIWKRALPAPQMIELYRTLASMHNGHMAKYARKTLITLLHTCPESHQVVMDTYRYTSFRFGTLSATPKPSSLLVSPHTDIVYLTAPDQVIIYIDTAHRTQQLAQFTTIAMPAAVLSFFLWRFPINQFLIWIHRLTNLKKILIIGSESHEQHGSSLGFKRYYDTCPRQEKLNEMWKCCVALIDRDIPLIWVQPYRDGRLAKGATHGH